MKMNSPVPMNERQISDGNIKNRISLERPFERI